MKHVKLGSQGLMVSRLGLGCMGMSQWYGKPNDVESSETLRKAIDLGVNFFDSAEAYGPFTNEVLIGKALKGIREKAVIATKFGFDLQGGKIVGVNSRPEHIVDVVNASLKRLDTDYIDILYQHRLDPSIPVEPVMRWLKTSGTTGLPKKIPYTLHWLQAYRIPAMKVLWATYIRNYPGIMDHPYAVLDTQTVRENVQEHLQGVYYQAISNRHPRIGAADWYPPWYEEPWFVPEMPIAHDQKMYLRIRHFVGKRLHCISAINPSTLISIKDYFSKFRSTLIEDINNGTLNGKPFDAPNEPLAEALDSILARPDFTLVDIWPELKFVSCWLTASASLYTDKLDSIFPGVKKLPFMSCGSEGVTTIPVDDTAYSQPLAITQAYFEFIPSDVPLREIVERREYVKTLLFDELQEGNDYHLIMSQGNGFYRFWTGDIYRVDKIVDGIPWIHFVRRDGVFHSFTGEKLTETQISEAIKRTFQIHKMEMGLFMCGPSWGEPPHYTLMVEVASGDTHNSSVLAATLDSQLKIENIEYAAKRESNRLAPIEIFTVEPDAVTRYIESKRTSTNANQYKYKPFQQDLDFLSAVITR